MNRLAIIAAFVLILAGLGTIHLLIRSEFADARQLRDEAGRVAVTRTHLADMLTLHLDAETGVRGFVLTQRPEFLEPYDRATGRREQIFRSLYASGAGESDRRTQRIEQLSRLKLANAANNVRDVRDGRRDLALARIASGRGKELMDAIRLEITQFDEAESLALRELEQASEDKRRKVESLVALVLLAIAGVLGATTVMLARVIAQRRLALRDARQAAEQERAMFDGAVDGMLLLDREGTILRSNPSVERMFGYAAADLAGRNNMFLMAKPFTPEQSHSWLNRVDRAGVDGAGRRQEFAGRRADGSTFDTEVAISRFGADGDHRFVAAIRDITHRKFAERMKSEFVSTVSHELRTPLTAIGGSLALLASGAIGKIDEKASRLVAIAHSNCERLIRLINDLLDIEKIESGKMSFDMRKVALAALIQRTVHANRQFAQDHGVTLEIGLPPWPQCVNGDPDRIEQVLTNLVSNAIKFSPTGEAVYITTSQDRGRVRIEVCDRGSGVPADFRDRIFSKFAQADSTDTRQRGGTGLGLAIVREIAVRHGGQAGFEDRAGGGSIFWFELPLLQEETSSHRVIEDGMPVLLHLDDDIDCLDVVASAFAGRATLVSASTMAEARAVLSAPEKTIVGCIVDVSMGPDNGLDIIPELRAAAPDLPVVLFTAHDGGYADVRADAVLVKSKTSLAALVETTMALVTRAARSQR